MFTFIISVVLVFIAVDLFVRFVLEPWIVGSDKKNKVSKSVSPKLDPSFKLATETMYDGGEPHTSDSSKSDDKNNSKDEVKS